MRSLLFVPGDSERKLEKALAAGADVLIVDLEDSVSAANKKAARAIAHSFIAAAGKQTASRLYVRVNDLSSGSTADDLAAVMPARPHGIMLPKCAGAPDLDRLSAMLRVEEANAGADDGSTRVLPIITETAAGVLAAPSYRPGQPRLDGVTWGAEDLSADIGARTNRDEIGVYTDVFRLARALTVLAASAAETSAIDTVFVDFRDPDGLRRECIAAERDGFTGKLAIHPGQVAIINEVFTPSPDALAEARMVVDAFAAAGNPGVVGIDGKMYDMPHLKRAERLLARASAAGVA
ncbi:HpcH/HpaI aldolase/citrate lyase family protein [Mesorhizobium xinjiangense]|uniref:HpcH/HpaI aldolase/citrate lyase family protein n=1 Tax=Mesorhizobium xinjiangense TaxID=2678685 RepID=UPI0012EE00C1|nr:CoA ester lyase [Mesorhizobium xinjiangense]